jgi:hypothetical protein
MDSGTKCKKSPQQAEENDNDQACSHAHGSDYSIRTFATSAWQVEVLESAVNPKIEPEIPCGYDVDEDKRFLA